MTPFDLLAHLRALLARLQEALDEHKRRRAKPVHVPAPSHTRRGPNPLAPILAVVRRIRAALRHHRHPVTRLARIDRARNRVADMHRRVGMVFFMPKTRDRFRNRLWHRWNMLGRDRAMLMGTILANPALKAELDRRRAPPPPAPPPPEPARQAEIAPANKPAPAPAPSKPPERPVVTVRGLPAKHQAKDPPPLLGQRLATTVLRNPETPPPRPMVQMTPQVVPPTALRRLPALPRGPRRQRGPRITRGRDSP